MLKKTLAWAIPVVALAGLGASASRWLPALLGFAGAHSDAIQGLTGLGQMVLWGGAVGLAGYRLWRGRGEAGSPVRGGVVAQGTGNVVSGEGVAVGRDVHGNLIVIQAGAGAQERREAMAGVADQLASLPAPSRSGGQNNCTVSTRSKSRSAEAQARDARHVGGTSPERRLPRPLISRPCCVQLASPLPGPSPPTPL